MTSHSPEQQPDRQHDGADHRQHVAVVKRFRHYPADEHGQDGARGDVAETRASRLRYANERRGHRVGEHGDD